MNLQSALIAAGLKHFNGTINLSATFTGKAGDAILASGSVDQTGNYVFEVDAQWVQKSWSKFSNYWSAKAGDDTMISLWNPTSTAEDVVATFYFGDGSGSYQVPIHLAAQASTMIDMAMLIADNKPDPNGKIFPANVREGSVQFASVKGTREWMTVVISSGTYNATTATCSGNCINCCGVSGFGLNPSNFFIGDGDVMACGSTAADCNGQLVNPTSWSSTNTSVMTVDQSGNVKGVGIGSADIAAVWDGVIVFTGNFCNGGCPTGNGGGQSSGNTIPVISGPNNLWYFGGQNPNGTAYPVSITLSENAGSGTWAVTSTAGSARINLSTTSGTSTTLTPTGSNFSGAAGDTCLTVTVSNQKSNAFCISVRTPWYLSLISTNTQPDSGFGYSTSINYDVYDNLRLRFAQDISWNEALGLNQSENGSNWVQCCGIIKPQGGPTAPLTDFLSGPGVNNSPAPSPTPTYTSSSGSGMTVYRLVPQTIYVGSRTLTPVLVQSDNLTYYIDHGAHTIIVQPPQPKQ